MKIELFPVFFKYLSLNDKINDKINDRINYEKM